MRELASDFGIHVSSGSLENARFDMAYLNLITNN